MKSRTKVYIANQRFAKFIIVGGTAAVLNIGTRIVFNYFVPYVPSIIFAFFVGLVAAFVMNRLFVFQDATNPIHHQAGWFVLVNLAALVQTIFISLVLYDYAFPAIGLHFHDETIAHAIGVIVPVGTSYLGHKHLSFRTSPRTR